MTKTRRRQTPEQIVEKLREADAMLAVGKSAGEVLHALEASEPTPSRWRARYGGMESEGAKRLDQAEHGRSLAIAGAQGNWNPVCD